MLDYEREDFELLQLQTLRQMFKIQFRKFADENSGFVDKYDNDRIIDDFVFMCMLVGNDFLTHTPHLEIDSGALSLMLATYMDLLPVMGGFLTDKEKIHPDRFETFLANLMPYEEEHFQRRSIEENEPRWGLSSSEDFSYREYYYQEKLNIDPNDEDAMKKRRAIVRDYIEGLHWVLNYYHNGCPSWEWFYPHLYSPLCTDMVNLREFYDESNDAAFDTFPFQQGEAFPSLVQLLSVLPPQSAQLLPESYAELMLDPASPIAQYYPKDFTTDANGKRQPWEAVVQIPFIESQALLDVVGQIDDAPEGSVTPLTKAELKRNERGQIWTYEPENKGTNRVVYSDAPKKFKTKGKGRPPRRRAPKAPRN